MKVYYDNKPSILEAVGNGSYLYRWNIEEVSFETFEGTTTQWMCDEVTVWSPISSNKILQTVLEDKYPNNREQKYINEYNSSLMGLYENEESEKKIQMYKDFLVEREAIKSQVDSDCNKLGIN